MTETFFIRIIASKGIFFEGRIRSLIFSTIDGEVELMAHHEEMIIAVAEGTLRYHLPDGEWIRVEVGVGTAQFANNRCVVLVDTCEKPEDVELAREQARQELEMEKLRQKNSIMEYKMAQASLARALSRLKETYSD